MRATLIRLIADTLSSDTLNTISHDEWDRLIDAIIKFINNEHANYLRHLADVEDGNE